MKLWLVTRASTDIGLDEFVSSVVLAPSADAAIELIMNAGCASDWAENSILGDWMPVREELDAVEIPTDTPKVVHTYKLGY